MLMHSADDTMCMELVVYPSPFMCMNGMKLECLAMYEHQGYIWSNPQPVVITIPAGK